jgi:CheY-like chemotaxis protein
MKILILEDNDARIALFQAYFDQLSHEVWYEKTTQGAIETLSENKDIDILFLDHDLGDEVFVNSNREDTGAGLCRWLVTSKYNTNISITIHSMNPGGVDTMLGILRNNNFSFAHALPFTQLAAKLRSHEDL